MENKEALNYFNGDELAASTWRNKYAAPNEVTPEDTHKRLAKEFFRIEEKFRWKKDPDSNLKLSNYGYSRGQLTEEKIFNLFKDYKYIVPGGSVMSGAGTNSLVSLSNCFRGDVKVLTKNGYIPIKDLVGKEVEILGGNGKWIVSPFKSYGKQLLVKLTLKRDSEEKVLYCTKNHKWFVGDNREIVETEKLNSGDILSSQYGAPIRYNPGYFGITHGILGSVESNCYPSINMDNEYLFGWLAGYFSMNGYIIPSTGRMFIKSSNKRDLEYIQDVCGVLGIFCSGIIKSDEDENFYIVNLNSGDFGKMFFISSQQRSYFSAVEHKKPKDWVVVSIDNTDLVEEVYCAEVPEIHSFTIEGNILTHNCFVIGSPKDSYADIMKTRSEQAQLMKRRK